jgi:isopentenyl phosphate kinase
VIKSTTGEVAALLGLGFIPVMHGDGVLDDVKVCTLIYPDLSTLISL